MTHHLRHADLVARALNALPPAERARVDAALAADDDLRRRFERIAGHLLRYDRLPAPPPPPPFERVAAALDRVAFSPQAAPDLALVDLQGARPRRRRLALTVAAAAVVLLALLLWQPWRTPPEAPLSLVPGRGLALLRDGRPLPAPAHAARPVRAGDELRCARAAEARLGGRVRVVLDGGSRLRVEGRDAVTLLAGRAFFEVHHVGPRGDGAGTSWVVRTAAGPVRVLGTVFEVDVRSGDLQVGVARGRVDAAGRLLHAGDRLAGGRITHPPRPAGAWFPAPQLSLEAAPVVPGHPLELRLVFANPGQVPLVLRGPASTRTPIWISLEDGQGRVLRELRPSRYTAGTEVLVPGARLTLAPGTRRVVGIQIPAPTGSAGTYFCRALYRPEGRPGVLSDPVPIEVRDR
jgi:ferric-dicitrate binding protein FerR (iron transport regulator)